MKSSKNSTINIVVDFGMEVREETIIILMTKKLVKRYVWILLVGMLVNYLKLQDHAMDIIQDGVMMQNPKIVNNFNTEVALEIIIGYVYFSTGWPIASVTFESDAYNYK